MLEQVKSPEKPIKIGNHVVRITDLNRASVTQIYDELLYIMRRENPTLVEDMIAEYNLKKAQRDF